MLLATDQPFCTVEKGLVAEASVTVGTTANRVWTALTDPDQIKKYMFGAVVVSRWSKGSPIVWKGSWKGKEYEDKGTILEIEPERFIKYSHFSPLSGLADAPENYHNVSVRLTPQGGSTVVSLSQDNNPDEEARRHSEENWRMMLTSLKGLLEGPAPERRL